MPARHQAECGVVVQRTSGVVDVPDQRLAGLENPAVVLVPALLDLISRKIGHGAFDGQCALDGQHDGGLGFIEREVVL